MFGLYFYHEIVLNFPISLMLESGSSSSDDDSDNYDEILDEVIYTLNIKSDEEDCDSKVNFEVEYDDEDDDEKTRMANKSEISTQDAK